MLVQTLSVIRSNIILFISFPLIFAAAFVLCDVYELDPGYASSLPWAIVGFVTQKAVILDGGRITEATKPAEGMGAYLSKFFVLLVLMPMLPAMSAASLLLMATGSANHSTILGGVFFLVAQTCLMSIIGTWPISNAVKADRSIKAAWQREKKGRFPRFLRLLGGALLPMIVQIPVGLAAIRAADGAESTDFGNLATAAALYFIVNSATAFGTAYTSVVIANVFMTNNATENPHAGSENSTASTLEDDTLQAGPLPHANP